MAVPPHTYPEGCVFKTPDDIKDKHITVMGLGLNGGGEASVRFFLQHGAYVIATDMKTQEQLKPTIDSIAADRTLDASRLTYRLGEHRIDDFADADCVIKNPGVRYDGNRYLAAAKAIETDISIFLHFTRAPVIAVTGSKGKSSTVSAIHYGFIQAGVTAFLGGNITVSPLTFLDRTNEKTPVVLELSSWQLADLRGRRALRPRIAVITKIVPDHQNWYGNMESYIADKRLIYADQTAEDYTILDADDDEPGTGPAAGGSWGDLFAGETRGTVLRYSRKKLAAGIWGVWQEAEDGQTEKSCGQQFCGKMLLPPGIAGNSKTADSTLHCGKAVTLLRSLSVPGTHMRTNVLNAALVLVLMGIPPEKTISVLGSWTGIPHRLQYFHEFSTGRSRIKFYNDSCATVPEAAAAASQAFGKSVIFITGGTDKGLSFSPLAETLSCRNKDAIPVKALYLLEGTGTDKLIPLLEAAGIAYNGPYNSLDTLLKDIKSYAESQQQKNIPDDYDIAVFSPGATSFGMFINEFDRGNKFMDAVKRLFA